MDQWQNWVAPHVGRPASRTRLKSAGGAGAFRVRGPRGEAILKCGVTPPEWAFYRAASASLREAGILVPALLAAGESPPWLLLEYLPSALPRERWGDVVHYLARWHELAPDLVDGAHIPTHVFRWDPALLSLTLNPSPEALHHRFSRELEELFSSTGWVHGDTNVTNWLLTADGAVALADWARLGHAHFAIDLAIALPGLPDWHAFETVAQTYCALRPAAGPSRHLARLMAVAKWWSALEFMDMGRQQALTVDGEAARKMLSDQLSSWIERTLVPL